MAHRTLLNQERLGEIRATAIVDLEVAADALDRIAVSLRAAAKDAPTEPGELRHHVQGLFAETFKASAAALSARTSAAQLAVVADLTPAEGLNHGR